VDIAMNTHNQPTLAELTGRAMAGRAERIDSPEFAGDVEPHEVLSGIRVDARAAWADAQLALQLLGSPIASQSAPADWAAFVDWNSGRLGIPLAAGQFPQRLREVAGLFAAKLEEPAIAIATGFASLKAWTLQNPSLTATALNRELGGDLPEIAGTSPAELNERAASLWLAGQRETALRAWQDLPAGPVASFNIGMAQLMLGQAKIAAISLKAAVDTLPDNSGWKHLAALYLSVAQVRA